MYTSRPNNCDPFTECNTQNTFASESLFHSDWLWKKFAPSIYVHVTSNTLLVQLLNSNTDSLDTLFKSVRVAKPPERNLFACCTNF